MSHSPRAGAWVLLSALGTALTDDQLRILWRMAPEPTLCFDGDAAGRRAAYRAIDRPRVVSIDLEVAPATNPVAGLTVGPASIA